MVKIIQLIKGYLDDLDDLAEYLDNLYLFFGSLLFSNFGDSIIVSISKLSTEKNFIIFLLYKYVLG